MKRLLLTILLVATVALCFGQVVFAQTATEQKICEIAKSDEKVTDAQCVVYERACVVAIKTEKFTSKSQYDEYVNSLREKIKEECEIDHVFVTRNPKVMKQIEELNKLDSDKRDEAIQKLIEEVVQRKPHVRPMPPKMTSNEL